MGGSDAAGETLSVGRRLKVLRTRRGMTREVLGGLVGRSASWVKAVETDRLAVPKLALLLRLAEALQLSDLAELTGAQSVPVVLFNGPGHDRLPAVRAAINRLGVLENAAPPSVVDMRARLAQAWAARHAAPNHREVLGRLLPALLDDARRTARACAGGPQHRAAALAVLAEAYALAQFFVAYQPAQDLLWRVAERGTAAAADSGDPHAIGVTAWLMTQAHRDAGDWDAADVVAAEASSVLQRRLAAGGADDNLAALWGALQFERGYTAARRGEIGTAWHYWDVADGVARRLPETYIHPVTSFSRAAMGAHAVTVAVELRQGGEAVRQSERSRPIPSRPRQARHWIEQARAYQLERRYEDALRALDSAYVTAPETIRYNGFARRILLEELDARDSRRRERASGLAQKIGLVGA